jgi:hypothetical protein
MVLATNHILESSDKSDYDAKIVNAAWIAIPSFFKRIHFFYDIPLSRGKSYIFFAIRDVIPARTCIDTQAAHGKWSSI